MDIPRLLFNPTQDLVEPFIEAARELERDGILAITGSCGFMARFQDVLAEAVVVPVCMSSLLLLPLMRLMHGDSANLGVLTASADALSAVHFSRCSTDMNSLFIRGMEGNPEFCEAILEGKRHDFDLDCWNGRLLRRPKTSCGKRLSTRCFSNVRA